MLIIVFIVIGLSILILGHEAGHFLVARAFGLKIDEFGFGFPPRIFAWRPRKVFRKKDKEAPRQALGETEYSFNWLPFGGFVKIAGEEDVASGEFNKLESLAENEKNRYFFFQPAWKRFLVIASGVGVNFLIGWLLMSVVLMVGSAPFLAVSGVQRSSPAEKAGILPGDVIERYDSAKGFIDFVNQHRGLPVTIEIKRGEKQLSFSVVPRADAAPNQGALGVLLSESGIERHGALSAFGEGFKEALYAFGAIVVTLYALLKNLLLHGSLLTGVVGPIGIVSIAEETGKIGMVYLAQLIGLISINLAVINLIPFPALDGGRLFLIALEKLKGSPIPFRFQAWANRLGFILLLLLMTVVTIRDIVRWFS